MESAVIEPGQIVTVGLPSQDEPSRLLIRSVTATCNVSVQVLDVPSPGSFLLIPAADFVAALNAGWIRPAPVLEPVP